jgi:hypothetical protein
MSPHRYSCHLGKQIHLLADCKDVVAEYRHASDRVDVFFTGGRLAYVFLPLCAGLGNGTIVLDNEKV